MSDSLGLEFMISISTDHTHKRGNIHCWMSSWAGWLSHYYVLSGNMILYNIHIFLIYPIHVCIGPKFFKLVSGTGSPTPNLTSYILSQIHFTFNITCILGISIVHTWLKH